VKESYRLTNDEKWVLKPQLYESSGGKCEYPSCEFSNYQKLTIHHVLPISIAIQLGMSREVINQIENLMILCRPHHNLADEEAFEGYRANTT